MCLSCLWLAHPQIKCVATALFSLELSCLRTIIFSWISVALQRLELRLSISSIAQSTSVLDLMKSSSRLIKWLLQFISGIEYSAAVDKCQINNNHPSVCWIRFGLPPVVSEKNKDSITENFTTWQTNLVNIRVICSSWTLVPFNWYYCQSKNFKP